MSNRRRMGTRARLVLLVGGDAEAARSCARAASPLPVVRAKHLATAASRVRSMKPIALVVASDVPVDDVAVLQRVAEEHAALIVRLEEAHAPDALRRVARR